MKSAMVVCGFVMLAPSWAGAQAIEQACLRSDREDRSRVLCGCIQEAANLTLSTKDQKLASTFYRDPQKAQEIRQSGRIAHAKFWERYKTYAEIAGTFCE